MNEIRKICILSEWLHGIPDEGIHNLAQNLLDQWQATYSVRALRIGSELRVNRLFLSWRLRRTLREICPDLVVYISPSSAKVTALLRAKMLKIYSSRSRVFVIATQPVKYRRVEKWILPLLAPDGVFVQAPSSKHELRRIQRRVYFLPSGVDTSRFVPVDDTRKRDLRKKYEVDEHVFVVLHVGHISRGRNVEALELVARLQGVMVIVVGSTSTPQDDDLARQLVRNGVRLIRDFVPRIEEMYQLADAYVFPVISEEAAIGVPLSVLEAMSCGIPVITRRFGGLLWMFREGDGFVYFDDEGELPELIGCVRKLEHCSTRHMVEPYDWKNVASAAMEMIRTGNSPR